MNILKRIWGHNKNQRTMRSEYCGIPPELTKCDMNATSAINITAAVDRNYRNYVSIPPLPPMYTYKNLGV